MSPVFVPNKQSQPAAKGLVEDQQNGFSDL
jgi:hypothetical protein